MANLQDNALGNYLRNRRSRLDPASLGITANRRRTPGLRREEVAQRANVSVTWYTWLEQGRGGTPSADVLDGIAHALALTAAEREHLFLLAQHRPPQVRYQSVETVSPQLQSVLDALPYSPAVVKTAAWDVVAWNRAAEVVLADYGTIQASERNILRLLFCAPGAKAKCVDWEDHARAAVASFRADTVKTGASQAVETLVADLCQASSDFARLWREHDVVHYGQGAKRMNVPGVGVIALEYSTFAVEASSDLTLMIFTAATPADAARIKSLVDGKEA